MLKTNIFILMILVSIFKCVQQYKHTNEFDSIDDSLKKAQIEEALDKYFNENSSEQQSIYIPPRNKKSKDIFKEKQEEESPLENHRKKSGIKNVKSGNLCSAQFKLEANVIIDSKKSIDNGAKMISIEQINKEKAAEGLNKLQESCMDKCCNVDGCDSALLSMRLGQDGYRCYLFSCNQDCFYVRHNDYIVLRMKSAEQLDHSILNKNENPITTGHKDLKTPCHKQYEFTCIKSKKCIPIYDVCNSFEDCDDKTDEIDCKSTTISSKTTTPSLKTTVALIDTDLESKIVQENNDEVLEKDKNIKPDYEDEYEISKQKAELVDYLNSLISERKKNKVVQNSPKDIFDSYMRTSVIKPITKKTISKATSTISATKKMIFHDEYNLNAESMISNFEEDDKIYFTNKETATTSTSGILTAIILLVFGISLVVAFFTYLVMSTKYMSKRIKWIREFNMKQKNVDVDPTLEADYLINGMYL